MHKRHSEFLHAFKNYSQHHSQNIQKLMMWAAVASEQWFLYKHQLHARGFSAKIANCRQKVSSHRCNSIMQCSAFYNTTIAFITIAIYGWPKIAESAITNRQCASKKQISRMRLLSSSPCIHWLFISRRHITFHPETRAMRNDLIDLVCKREKKDSHYVIWFALRESGFGSVSVCASSPHWSRLSRSATRAMPGSA